MKKGVCLLATLLAFVIMGFAMSVEAAEAPGIIDQGYCGGEGDGTNLTWTLDSDGVLVIEGRGEMKEWTKPRYRSEDDGTNFKWTLDSDGALAIEDQGSLKDWARDELEKDSDDYSLPPPWFKYRQDITSAIIRNGVINISWEAFESCINLSSIELPESLTRIGGSAFFDCASLSSINLPESLTSIGEGTFSDCVSLSSIKLPESLTSIGDWTFYNCRSLSSINLPESLTSIGEGIFSACVSLSSIKLPESLTRIGDLTFLGCASLSSIKLPESLTSIGDWTFAYCASLSSIKLPESLTSIGEGIFYNCASLSSIKLPESLTSIGDSAFRNCASLSSIKLPESLTSIGGSAFSDCASLSSIKLPESLTSIGGSAFYDCASLSSIELPESLTSIGGSAFYDCASLSSIELPESLTSIGDWIFFGCASLSSIKLPESLTSIGEGTFSNCASLSSIKLPESLTRIGRFAFDACASLSSIKLPESLTSIGEGTYTDCASLSSIKLPESLTSIGSRAFYNCFSLNSIKLPESLTSIGSEAFGYCKSLSSINLPESITRIEKETFIGCTSFSSIKLPESITSIEYGAFDGCRSLSSIKLPESLMSLGDETFAYCTSLSSIVIPESLTSIGDRAFYGCRSLSGIYIPSNVTIINESAFMNTGLKNIYYAGTENEWNSIHIISTGSEIGDYNGLLNANIHYNSLPFDYYLVDASSYNKDLAFVSANLSLKAYNDIAGDESVENYLINDLGFGDGSKFHTGSYGGTLAYTLATRKFYGIDADDNTDILVIAAQGSPNPYEMIPEAVSKPDYDNKKAFGGHVPYGIVEEYYNAIVKGLPKVVESGKHYKVMVTGHGLAGAAANLVAANLSDGRIKGVNTEKADVFCYTFGALNPLDENVVIKGDYENIHNIYNIYDTFSPLHYGVGEGFGMFGQMHLFVRDNRTPEQRNRKNDESIFRYVYRQIYHHVNHDMEKYCSYVEGVKNGQNDLITEKKAKHVSVIIGSVDVAIICDNKLVGQVTKNTVDATANAIDIRIEGDSKIILYPDERQYEIHIMALDEGSMTFGQIDLVGRGETKVIKDVSLTKGKPFSGTVGGGRTADEFRLYETNRAWTTLTEALSVAWVEDKNDDLVSFYKLMSFAPRLYRNFLKREPDETGLGDWVDALYSGRGTGANIVSGFVLSKEYQANSLSDEEYITAMYRIIFNREPDEDGLNSWITVLDNGCTNKKVLEGFINSDEFYNLCKDLGIKAGSYKSPELPDNNYLVASFVARLYRIILLRRYDRKGLDNWVRALVYRTATGSLVVKNFFNSQEFLNRNLDNKSFVTVAYEAILNREPDAAGLKSWMDALERGYTRNQVIDGFLKSTEFGVLCAEYGITR